MENIQSSLCGIKPSSTHEYIDTIQVWLQKPPLGSEISIVRGACGSIGEIENEPAWWDERWKQRLLLHQPQDALFEYFDSRNDVLLNRVDVSLDLTFLSPAEVDEIERIFHLHFFKSHHRNQKIKWFHGTRYTGMRWENRNIVSSYGDKFCRVSGEPHCFHIDWSITGRQALKQAGLDTFQSLLDLDYRAFWERRLRFKQVLAEKLIKRMAKDQYRSAQHQRMMKLKRRGYPYDPEKRFIGFIHRATAIYGVQFVWDMFASAIRLDRIVVPLDCDNLLPSSI